MNVIPFPSSRRPRRSPLRPPPALQDYGPPPAQSNAFDAAEDRKRMQENFGALVAVIIIVALGTWLMDRLATYSRTMICVEAGHRSCFPQQVLQTNPWDR